MSEQEKNILSEIDAFKRKKVINLSLKGLIFTLAIILSLFIAFNTLEFTFRFGVNTRTFFFFSFLLVSAGLFAHFIFRPLSHLTQLNRAIDNEKAAKEIGQFFPEIGDKLLNIIQLRSKNAYDGSLVYAGIHQKISELPALSFNKAIVISQNKKFLVWLIIPVVILLSILSLQPEVITKSTERIANFDKDFIPEAPFLFDLKNSTLQAFRNEDYTMTLSLSGENIPNTVYISDNGRKLKMFKEEAGSFSYIFTKIQSSKSIRFEAAGYSSETYNISVISRPDLKTFNMYLER